MDAVILAGGLGTRLRSVVSEVPKCMAPVAGKPFLYYLLQDLAMSHCIDRVILSVGYLREVIFEWVDTHRAEFPFVIDYAIETEPLGTGGGIRLALAGAKSDDVLVLNGDTYFAVNLSEMLALHAVAQTDITLALRPMHDFDRYGTVELIETGDALRSGIIARFVEKQWCAEGLINGGVYIVNRRTLSLDHLPAKFSFETVVLEPEAAARKLTGVVQEGYFIDIGIPTDYAQANEDFKTLFA